MLHAIFCCCRLASAASASGAKQTLFGPSASNFEAAVSTCARLLKARQSPGHHPATLQTALDWAEQILRQVSGSSAISLETADPVVAEIVTMVVGMEIVQSKMLTVKVIARYKF